MNNQSYKNLAIMTLDGPFSISRGEQVKVDIDKGQFYLVDKATFDEFVDDFLRLRGAQQPEA